MGFGLIFLGYIFTVFDMGFIVNEALSVFVCDILCCTGYALIVAGLSRYSKYSGTAKLALTAFSVQLALHTGAAAVQGLWHFGAMGEQLMARIMTWLFPLIAVFYALSHILLFLALRKTAKETECPKVETRAVSSISLTAAFCILNIALALPFAFPDYMSLIRYGLFLVITAVNAVTVYSAYMWICLDTDLEKEKAEAAKTKK